MNDTASLATIAPNEIAIVNHDGECFEVSCPNGWDDAKKLSKLVLDHKGGLYSWTGWNSDRNVSYFKIDRLLASIVAR